MRGSLRFGVLVYDPMALLAPDPDTGEIGVGLGSEARIAGSFRTPATAMIKAVTVRRAAERAGLDLEAVVVPVLPGNTSARDIAKEVTT